MSWKGNMEVCDSGVIRELGCVRGRGKGTWVCRRMGYGNMDVWGNGVREHGCAGEWGNGMWTCGRMG